MNNTISIKTPQTQYAVSSFITDRFSPRAFADQPIPEPTLNTLFEAASWAPSANNEQPWEYFYAHKGTEGFEKLWNCLLPGNQPWSKHAAVLVVAAVRKNFEKNGQPNGAAEHDLGMANANLMLQARALDIFTHCMGGFDKQKTMELLGLGEDYTLRVMIAMGYLGDPEMLEEPFKGREATPRTRKQVAAFTHAV